MKKIKITAGDIVKSIFVCKSPLGNFIAGDALHLLGETLHDQENESMERCSS